MKIPQKFMGLIRGLQQDCAQQRRAGEIETLCEVGAQNRFQSLLLRHRRFITPIVMRKGHFGFSLHDLHRFFHALPNKSRAQNGMMFHHALPRALKRRYVQRAA